MKLIQSALAGALVCAALSTQIAKAADDMDASLKATTEQEAKVGQTAIATKDVGPLIAYYADDAWVMPPNEPIQKGKAAAQASWQASVDSGALDGLSWWPVRTETSGQMGVEYGEWDVKDADGKVVATGKYLAVWKHTPDGWKMIADTWNSSDPLPAAEAK